MSRHSIAAETAFREVDAQWSPKDHRRMVGNRRGFVISPWILAIGAGAFGWYAHGWIAGIAAFVLFVATVTLANYAYLHWVKAPGASFFRHIRLIKWTVFVIVLAAVEVTSI